MKALSNEDMARIVEYVDGTLDERERAEFELRMSAEPELAAAVEGTLDSDLLLTRMAPERSALRSVPSAGRSRGWYVALAAAAAVLLWVGLDLTRGRGPGRAEFWVATAAGFEAPSEYVAATGGLSELVPPGLGVLRGGNSEPNVGAQEFANRSASAERTLLSRATNIDETLRAGYFVLPLRVEQDASFVVCSLPEVGEASRLWPAEPDPAAAARAARLRAGAHVLPRERIEYVAAEDRLAYHRGFLVPFGARSVSVIVAARRAELTGDDVARLDAALAGGRDALHGELTELGFHLEELVVDEP